LATSAELCEDRHERRTKAIIPNRCDRKQRFSFVYLQAGLAHRARFNRLKDFYRFAIWLGVRNG
jgi:hypothetical protein